MDWTIGHLCELRARHGYHGNLAIGTDEGRVMSVRVVFWHIDDVAEETVEKFHVCVDVPGEHDDDDTGGVSDEDDMED